MTTACLCLWCGQSHPQRHAQDFHLPGIRWKSGVGVPPGSADGNLASAHHGPHTNLPSHPDTYYLLLLPVLRRKRWNYPAGRRIRRLRFTFTEREEFLDLYESGLPVLVYNYGIVTHEGVPEDRFRSVMSAIYGIEEILTDDSRRPSSPRGVSRAGGEWPAGGSLAHAGHPAPVRNGCTGKPAPSTLLGVQNGWYMGTRKPPRTGGMHGLPRGPDRAPIDICITSGPPADLTRRAIGPVRIRGLSFASPGTDRRITSVDGLLARTATRSPCRGWIIPNTTSVTISRARRLCHRSSQFPRGGPSVLWHFGVAGRTHTVHLAPRIQPIELRYRLWIHKETWRTASPRALQIF